MVRVVSMMVMRTMEFGERCACGFRYGAAVAMFGTDRRSRFMYRRGKVGG